MPNLCVLTKKIYLGTPFDRFEYVRVRFNEIAQDFINEFNLTIVNGAWWIYLEIHKG